MKKAVLFLMFLGLALTLMSVDKVFSHSNSAPVMDCTSCHQGEFKADIVSINGLPKAYKPGAKYKLTLTIKSDLETLGESMGGFALEVSDGKILVTDKQKTQFIEKYLTHTLEGVKTRTWSFTWQAPKSDKDITFIVMAMASNGDYSPFGDVVGAQSYTIKAVKK
ncbi:MAG: hypothetical protein N2738_02055 [Thermodesulfovibrionales bacterium]|nr:hypothetical protein [Thermodesulfovibrionales bacterium]